MLQKASLPEVERSSVLARVAVAISAGRPTPSNIAGRKTTSPTIRLPPATISLPFKLMLFVLVDGWQLIIGSLAESFFV